MARTQHGSELASGRMWTEPDVIVIGGGLAGAEAAWQLAQRGHKVSLVEMKPVSMSPAHQTPLLCELVCSNSLRSNEPVAGAGLLKQELRRAGSMVIDAADSHAVPAGSALAVERFGFGRAVTTRLAVHPNVRIERRVVDDLPAETPTIIATGPLTGGGLAAKVRELFGGDKLFFYDAIAPIVAADSIDPEHSFRASRWGKGDDEGGDYINCPVDTDLYYEFVREIAAARKISAQGFEEMRFFEGCLPIEVMVSRGEDVLRYGPMRPVGLDDPKTGRWPYALIQLRPENKYLTAYNLVGFQTRMAYPEQKRIFSMVPALANAEFLRFGSIHRNTFVDSPNILGDQMQLLAQPNLRFAGLITGVEGYVESCAMGLLAALFTDANLRGKTLEAPPETTAFGGLFNHIHRPRARKEKFEPTNINFGLMPGLGYKAKKKERKKLIADRAFQDFTPWVDSVQPVSAS